MSKRNKYEGPIAPMIERGKQYDMTKCNPRTGHKWEGKRDACFCGKMTRPDGFTGVSNQAQVPKDPYKKGNLK